ncbi:hypothetical protein EJ110_NYTH38624 [Nymphaea thermarum]|nr:hypothetical protein EJ110_NYTH38624 [Nymphaea thermarum]
MRLKLVPQQRTLKTVNFEVRPILGEARDVGLERVQTRTRTRWREEARREGPSPSPFPILHCLSPGGLPCQRREEEVADGEVAAVAGPVAATAATRG